MATNIRLPATRRAMTASIGVSRNLACTAPTGAPPKLSLYIQERERRDGPGRLRYHTLRLDGFASVCAPLTGGLLTTKPLQFAGN